MDFEVQQTDSGCLLVTCRGSLSWEGREQLAEAIESHLRSEHPAPHVVLELSGVEYINSAGLGSLFQLVQRLRGRGGQLALAAATPTVTRLFHSVGLDRLAIVSESIEDALTQLATAAPGGHDGTTSGGEVIP
jgi:anti-sigma B factor antagonist